jgi:Ser/Thr protein kinase RdoA (MazF antagonist)
MPGMNADATIPFSGLTPDCILNAMDSAGYRTDGRLLALNSYENRVYQIGIEDGTMRVAKFYRPGRWSDAAIAEEHALVAELAAHEIPVVPACAGPDGRTLREFSGFRFAVYPKEGGRAPELDRAGTLEWLGRFLGRIHAVGALQAFDARPTLDMASFGEEPRAYLLANGFVPADLDAAYRSVVEQALDGARRCYQRAGCVTSLRLHGDCHPGNVLWVEGGATSGPHFVDFDDARMGPAVQDLWMLLSGERAEMSLQLADLLSGYEDFRDFDRRELHLVEALRTLRLIHYAAWLARRWNDPAFPAAFPWFNSQRYWQDHILQLREQIAAMDEGPLWADV